MNAASTALVRRASVALTVAHAFCTLAAPASAQISGLGPTMQVAAVYTRGVDVAYDPKNNVYLVVGSFNSVVGTFVNEQGVPLGAPFHIQPPTGGVPHGQYPAVAWGAHANNGNGGFLVIWPSENSRTDVGLHGRMVAYPTGAYGPVQRLSDGFTAFFNAAPAVGYSPTSQRFLVVWPTQTDGNVKARLVDTNGTPASPIVPISAGYGRNPAIAWNSANHEFGVSFSGETSTTAFSVFARISPSTGALLGRTSFNVVSGLLTTITDLDYNANTNQYVMTWFETNTHVKTVVLGADGAVVGGPTLISTQLGSYDALSLAYNPVSQTNLVIGLNRVDDNLLAAEIRSSGIRNSAEVRVNTAGALVRYPRLTANTSNKTWNASFTGWTFAAVGNQIIQTTTTGTGGTDPQPPPPPPPPPGLPVPNPKMNTDVPAANASVSGGGFVIAGWALDLGAPAGTGVDVVQVWAYPAGGGDPRFVGTASYGHARPDVGGIFGSRFTASGFQLVGAIDTPGTYDLAVFAHSTVTDTFNNVQTRRVLVTAPPTIPRMNVDVPARSQQLGWAFTVAGWALDLGSGTSAGVDAVHVWAYPVDGGAPIFVGAANCGGYRPDVGAAFGASRYNNTGFYLQVPEGVLPKQKAYNLVVFARSVVANTFNNSMLIPITVN